MLFVLFNNRRIIQTDCFTLSTLIIFLTHLWQIRNPDLSMFSTNTQTKEHTWDDSFTHQYGRQKPYGYRKQFSCSLEFLLCSQWNSFLVRPLVGVAIFDSCINKLSSSKRVVMYWMKVRDTTADLVTEWRNVHAHLITLFLLFYWFFFFDVAAASLFFLKFNFRFVVKLILVLSWWFFGFNTVR